MKARLPQQLADKKIETILVIGAFILVWAGLTFFQYFYNIRMQLADGAFAAQIFWNFRDQPVQVSTLATSIMEAMHSAWYRPAAEVCSAALTTENPNQPLFFHFYLIGFVFLPLARIVDIYVLMAVLQAGAYASVLLFTYVFARRVKLAIIPALLLTFLVSQHPVWYSGLFGQFYFNRLFLPFCALVIWQLTNKNRNPLLLIGSVLLALSTNEVYGVTLATLLGAYAVLFERRNKLLYGLAAFCFLASAAMIYYIQHTYVGYSTQSGFIANVTSIGFFPALQFLLTSTLTQKTLFFVLITVGLFGLLTFLRWRYALVLFFFLLPNVLVNIGGAEKVGWTTHYHAAYFVPMIWLVILSIRESSFLQKSQWRQIIVILILIIATMFIDRDTLTLKMKPHISLKNFTTLSVHYARSYRTELAFHQNLASAVKPTDSITLPEAVAYHFIKHPIYYYPMDIDRVDKAIFLYDPAQSGDQRFSTINYGQQAEDLDACIIPRMKMHGFDFTRPKIVDQWAIIGKWYDR